MEKPLLAWTVLGLWFAAMAAFPLKFYWNVSYVQSFLRSMAGLVFLVACFQLNYAIADALGLSKDSSGYARGRRVISPYGFLVQLLMFVEVGAVWWVLRKRKKPNS